MKINRYQEASDLWLTYREGLRNYILKKTRNPETADEICQEVLMKVYKSCCSDKEIVNVRSWLFQISHNAAIDYLKLEKKLVFEVAERVEQDDSDPYQHLAEMLDSLIVLLPEKYATPLRLSEIEGLKQADIALKLNLGLSATKSRIQRARDLLKQQIMECYSRETDAEGKHGGFIRKRSCIPFDGE